MGQGYEYLKKWFEVSIMERTKPSLGNTLRKTLGLPALAKISNLIHCNSGFYFYDQDSARASHHLNQDGVL